MRHPKYNPETKDNDIALLELNRDVVLNKNVGLACLPTAPPDPGDSNCYVTGTFAFEFRGGGSIDLSRVDVLFLLVKMKFAPGTTAEAPGLRINVNNGGSVLE